VKETSELIIIGAGITGLNALAVASDYLSARDRVVLLDSRPRAGGMWVDTYDFVRLHQPHPIFTAGDIAWQLGKPASHLATRDEVLDHLRYCVDVAREKVDLEERFGSEYVEHAEAGGTVTVTVRDSDGRIETLTTKRLIKAYGNHVLPSSPLSISSAAVRSTTPASITLSMYNLGRIARTLPPKVMIDCGLDFDRWYPKARQMAGATAFLATQRRDASKYRKTLDTLGERFDVRVGPVHQ
jgi:hypothetical protein